MEDNRPKRPFFPATIVGKSIAFILLMMIVLMGLILLVLISGPNDDELGRMRKTESFRGYLTAVIEYAEENGSDFPSPTEWPDDDRFVYLGGRFTQSSEQIILYELLHEFEDEVLVGFADGRIEEMPHDQFEEMLTDQLREQTPSP